VNTDWIRNIQQFLEQGAYPLRVSGSTGHGDAVTKAASQAASVTGDLPQMLLLIVTLGIVSVILGISLCVYRLYRGPHLADRVLAADTLSLHVVALVILLAIRLETAIFFDAVLVVAIIGFASTLAFAQYIGNKRQDHQAESGEDVVEAHGIDNSSPKESNESSAPSSPNTPEAKA
jgi:multicomponent K+:H+ antiporter subunit F